jgi:uncharacterized protein involved in high-affinity Fe2+ transport
LAGAVAVLLSGCAAADKKQAQAGSTSLASAGSGTSTGVGGMDMSSGSSGASTAGAGGGAAAGSTASAAVKPVPMQVLGTALWQGMKITAQAMTPVPFVVYDGTSERTVKPGDASMHLMVMLNDADTGVPIPYASVWATITKAGRVVFDERQWPMISRYMGPHYGDDVSLPGAGTYRLSLLVSPPVSARHVEYQGVWLKPHRVDFTFSWKPAS